jgi:hypothetical protein
MHLRGARIGEADIHTDAKDQSLFALCVKGVRATRIAAIADRRGGPLRRMAFFSTMSQVKVAFTRPWLAKSGELWPVS